MKLRELSLLAAAVLSALWSFAWWLPAWAAGCAWESARAGWQAGRGDGGR
jgi:hypothetical protein